MEKVKTSSKSHFCGAAMKMDADIFGMALTDFLAGQKKGEITTFSSLDEEDRIPVSYLFRNFDAMPPLEQLALAHCKGSVLDIGAGAGSHSLCLQQQGFDVTALDSSKGAIATCGQRGIAKTVQAKLLEYDQGTYDTLLLLMNGIGIVGTLEKLAPNLAHMKRLLSKGGQILLDSSNIIYMFDTLEDVAGYYGEVSFQLQYKNAWGKPFDWLYVDFETLNEHCKKENLKCELLSKGNHYDYLVRLTEI